MLKEKDKKNPALSPVTLIPEKYWMFNGSLSIQSHRKSPLHPNPCPEPGGCSGYGTIPACWCLLLAGGPGLSLQLLLLLLLLCALPEQSLGQHSHARHGEPGTAPGTASCSNTWASAGDDCSPSGSSPASAAHTDDIEAAALGKTGN